MVFSFRRLATIISQSVKHAALLHILSYIKGNIITTKLQKLYSPVRNLRAGHKSPALFLKTSLHGRFIARTQNIHWKAWTLRCILRNKVSVCRSLTHECIKWFFPSFLIWYYMYTETHRLTRPCKYILTPPVMCSQQQYVLQWMNNSLIPQIYFSVLVHSVLAFKNYWLVEVICMLIRFIKTRFFSWNTKNIDWYGVN